jgi:hypothetical protein
MSEAEIRADERERITALLNDHADTIGEFVGDGSRAVRLVAFMISLGPASSADPA